MPQCLPFRKLTESIQTQEQRDKRGRECVRKKSKKKKKMMKRKKRRKRKKRDVKMKKMQLSLTTMDATTLITISPDRNIFLKLMTSALKSR